MKTMFADCIFASTVSLNEQMGLIDQRPGLDQKSSLGRGLYTHSSPRKLHSDSSGFQAETIRLVVTQLYRSTLSAD